MKLVSPGIARLSVHAYPVSVWVLMAVGLAACHVSPKKEPAPDEHHFRKVVLAEGLPMPMALDIDSRNRIFIAESGGNIMIFDPQTHQLKKAGFLPTHDGSEYGLTGLRLDPHFEKNGFIYLHYFLKDTARIECISRFTMQGDSLDLASEKNYLQIPHDNTCCHTAGGLAFDPRGNLYIATGDNSDAFFTHYALTDDEPGHRFADALRSAGNTNDYRGKILRIHPEPDGSYTIPEGNLFPKGMDSTRPEIYIMGLRNPYRISIDPETGYLYWGEVGPDADKDSTRGSMGYDEFNQAREAGNFGWPLFIGNNQAYNHVYFGANERIGEKFDTAHPVNFSRNNTGKKILPLPHPAFIWYPYDSSAVFPSFGSGGRTAIGGPVYHYDPASDSKVKFPAYFDHCWFIADWMRNWIKAVHLDANSDRGPIDDFMPDAIFKKPIFLQFGPDGALYLLEYGSSWWSNPDTKLVKIEYIADNLPPVAHLQLDKAYGKVPLTVHFSAEGSIDYDNKDQLQYAWLGAGGDTLGRGLHAVISFGKPGKYPVKLVVQDNHGAVGSRDTVISAGNAIPEVSLLLLNHSFYWDTIRYAAEVKDEEDGTLGHGIAPSDVHVTLQYLPPGSSFGKGGKTLRSKGEVLMNESDCKSCHLMDGKSVGPSFRQIADRYSGKENMIPHLAEKILKGGTGVWGTASMSPHPQLNIGQTTGIVQYIYSLATKTAEIKTLPVQGSVAVNTPKNQQQQKGYYVLQVGYTDKGGDQIGPLSGSNTVVLRSPLISAADFDQVYDAKVTDGSLNGINNSHGVVKDIDLTAVRQVLLSAKGSSGGGIDIRLDSVNGFPIGKALLDNKEGWQLLPVNLAPLSGRHDVYFVFADQQRFRGISLQWVQLNTTVEREK